MTVTGRRRQLAAEKTSPAPQNSGRDAGIIGRAKRVIGCDVAVLGSLT